MYCSHCGQENDGYSQYCRQCGKQLNAVIRPPRAQSQIPQTHETPDTNFREAIFFAGAVYLLFIIGFSALLIYAKGAGHWMWPLYLCLGIIGLIIYLCSRPDLVQCEHCYSRKLRAARLCPHCGHESDFYGTKSQQNGPQHNVNIAINPQTAPQQNQRQAQGFTQPPQNQLPLSKFCSDCGARNKSDDAFCENCGSKLNV
jgi:uncharacterized membrane protein YvbJ